MTWRTLLERIGANKLAMKLTTRNRSSKSGGSSGTLDAGRKGGFTGRSDIQLVSTGGMGINKGFTLLPEEEGGSLVALDPGRIRVDSSFRIDEENGRGVRRY